MFGLFVIYVMNSQKLTTASASSSSSPAITFLQHHIVYSSITSVTASTYSFEYQLKIEQIKIKRNKYEAMKLIVKIWREIYA